MAQSTTSASSHTRLALDAINTAYHADDGFAHLRAFANFVPGDGPDAPRVIIIGEAPGRNENEQGKPFVGASGRLLEELLYGIKMRRQDCYITNVVKYRPPDNRTPTEYEIDAARPYLREEIKAFVNLQDMEDFPPVLLLGRVALHMIDEDATISHSHGRVIERGPWKFLVMYHPAAALRNGNLKHVMAGEFNTLRRLVQRRG